MTFDERASDMGFPQRDPHYYTARMRRRSVYLAAACVFFAIFGFVIRYAIAKTSFENARLHFDDQNRKLSMEFNAAEQRAKKLGSLQAQSEAFMKRKAESSSRKKD